MFKKPAKVSAGNLHTPNETMGTPATSDQDLENGMDPEMLTDPEDETSGDTHTVEAADEQNVGALDNDVDPTEGYLDTEQTDGLDNAMEETPIEASEEDSEEDSDSFVADEDDDWDAPLEDSEDDVEGFDEDGFEETDDEDSDDSEEDDEEDELVTSNDDMALLDIDEVPDTDDNIAFASFNNKVLVLRANRVIASLNKKQAVKASVEDTYLTPQFETVVASQVAEKGLRQGLTSMGFELATVNVTKASVVNKRVEKEVHKTTAAMRKVHAAKETTFAQSLAIAAVGINRSYFKGATNPLKAALEQELAAAGVKGAQRIVAKVMSNEGVAYAHSIVALANKLQAMPQEARDGFVQALDMTSGEDENFFGEETADTEELDDGFDDFETEDGEEFETDTVEQTLATAGVSRTKSEPLTNKGQYSTLTASILAGKIPF